MANRRIIRKAPVRIAELERENAKLNAELNKAHALIDYIAACDYPEIFDAEDASDEEESYE